MIAGEATDHCRIEIREVDTCFFQEVAASFPCRWECERARSGGQSQERTVANSVRSALTLPPARSIISLRTYPRQVDVVACDFIANRLGAGTTCNRYEGLHISLLGTTRRYVRKETRRISALSLGATIPRPSQVGAIERTFDSVSLVTFRSLSTVSVLSHSLLAENRGITRFL